MENAISVLDRPIVRAFGREIGHERASQPRVGIEGLSGQGLREEYPLCTDCRPRSELRILLWGQGP